MVTSNSEVSKILKTFQSENNELIKESKKDKDISQKQYSGLYVFISFDLVNSTQYKSIEQNWPNLINGFYDQTALELEKCDSTETLNVWKYIGDEILFFGKVMDPNNLIRLPKDVMKVLNIVNEYIFNKFEESRGLLGIKATIWCAQITQFREDTDTKKRQNYLLEKRRINSYDNSDTPPAVVYDFLGPDIDAGFRLAKQCARKNQVVVSAELSYLIMSHIIKLTEEEQVLEFNKYRILDLVSLKGIWHGRQYPVIWYREQWEKGVFEYDQSSEEYSFYRERYSKGDGNHFDTYSFLKYIMISIGKAEINNKYSEIITESTQDELLDLHPLAIKNPVEIHLVAVIFDKNGKVLLLKRGNKKSNKDKFDFGCVNLKYNKEISYLLKEYYSKLLDLNSGDATIRIVSDEADNPIPVSTYTYEKSTGNIVSGFIFSANVNTQISIDEEVLKEYGYSEYKVVDVNTEELENLEMFKNGVENIVKCETLQGEQKTAHKVNGRPTLDEKFCTAFPLHLFEMS